MKEREYLDALVRGVYARHDLPAGHVLREEDVYFAAPLHKGQISTREFEGGEALERPLCANAAVNLSAVDAPYGNDPELLVLIPDRGAEPRVAAYL